MRSHSPDSGSFQFSREPEQRSVFHGDSGDCRVEPPASRAVHHTREDPWKISLTTLFEQFGMAVPHSKSVRKKILTQHHTSAMHQLNNAPVLRVLSRSVSD